MRAQEAIMREAGYVTSREAAEAIGLIVGTVHRMIKNDHLRGARAGYRWYVSVKSLLEAYADAAPILKRIHALGVAAKDEPVVTSSRFIGRGRGPGEGIHIDPPLRKARRVRRAS